MSFTTGVPGRCSVFRATDALVCPCHQTLYKAMTSPDLDTG